MFLGGKIFFGLVNECLLSTEWVDYVEEPMKYQALRPHFFSVVGGWRVLGVVLWVPMTPPIMGASDALHVIFWQFGEKT